MRLHIEWGKTLQAILPFQINPSPARFAKSATRQPGILARGPMARHSVRLELLSQNDGIAEDSAMITAVYEAHLSIGRRCWRLWLNYVGTMLNTPRESRRRACLFRLRQARRVSPDLRFPRRAVRRLPGL